MKPRTPEQLWLQSGRMNVFFASGDRQLMTHFVYKNRREQVHQKTLTFIFTGNHR